MTLVLVVGGLAMLASIVMLVRTARSAPMGYEDEKGFHFGVSLELDPDPGHKTPAPDLVPVPAHRSRGKRRAA